MDSTPGWAGFSFIAIMTCLVVDFSEGVDKTEEIGRWLRFSTGTRW
jgi:hypothetical protein